MADPKWSSNMLLNPTAASGLDNWTVTGTASAYAAGSDDDLCFQVSANSMLRQQLTSLLVVPNYFLLKIDTHADSALTPQTALVRVTAVYNNGKFDISFIPLAQLTSITFMKDTWLWHRTEAIIPIKDTTSLNKVMVDLCVFDIGTNVVHFDNVQLLASLDIAGVINMSPRSIIGDVIMDGTLEATALKANQLIVGENVLMGENAVIVWGNIDSDTIPPLGSDFDPGSNFTQIGSTWIYTGTLTAQQIMAIEGITALSISGTLNCGETLEIGPPNALGGQCHINTALEAMRFQAHVPGNYIAYWDHGGLSFYVNDTEVSSIRPDGTTSLKPDPVDVTAITYKGDGTGFDTDLDGAQDSWTWTKDGTGRITKLESSGGRIINVTY